MKKRIFVLILSVTLAAALLSGCFKKDAPEDAVSVSSVAMICGIGSVGTYDRYGGMVVSRGEASVERSENQVIDEVLVEVGDTVKEGDVLFTYDSESSALTLEKAKLQLEQMQNSLTNMYKQKSQLEADKLKAPADQQLSYSIEIQALEADILESKYNQEAKNKEIAQLQTELTETEVTAPISGTISAINESQYDNYGNPQAYMIISMDGSYRVKGIVNETNAYSLYEGMPVLIRSRVDEQTWTGSVSGVDFENPESSQKDYYMVYDSMDSMSTSSKYPFYIELDSTEGLMMGQHVYIEPDYGQGEKKKQEINLPEYYIVDADSDPWVWAASSKDKLEKRKIRLGYYDEFLCTYVVESGLSAEDYIAFPDETCSAGAPVSKFDENSFINDVPGVMPEAEYGAYEGAVDMAFGVETIAE